MRAPFRRATVAAAALAFASIDASGEGGPASSPPGKPPTALAGAGWVSGTVVDENDRPLCGADVKVVREKPPGVWTGTSDAKGFFTVKGAPAGPALAIVSAKGRVPFQKEVRVPATGVASLQAKLEPGVRFAGRLVDTKDKPVAGARLVAFDSSNEGKRSGWGWVFYSFTPQGKGVSNEDGTFEVDGLSPASTYRLHVVHPRYLALDLPGLDARPGGGHESLDVTLEPAAWATGVVVDPQGRAVAGARVHGPGEEDEVLDPFGGVFRFASDRANDSEATTDARGRFLVGSLAPGEARITASADSYFDGNVVTDGLVAGAEKGGLKVVLEPATAWIEGLAVDEEGKPIAGVEVSADGDQGTAASGKTDPQGRFRLERVRSRSPVTLTASHEGHAEAERQDVPLNTTGLRLAMPRAARLKVKVLGPDGKAIAEVALGVTLTVEGKRPRVRWTWHAQTEAGLDVPLPVGEVSVLVASDGFKGSTVGPWTTEPAKAVDGGIVRLEKAKAGEAPGD